MNHQFHPLNDNDLLLFDKDTFTVERFKEFVLITFKNKLNLEDFKQGNINKFWGCSLQYINTDYNIDSKVTLKSNQSSLTTVSEEIECKLLKLGATAWKDGKLRFKATANYNNSSDPQLSLEVELEFCPNEPEQTEPLLEQSETLDDLRRKLETL